MVFCFVLLAPAVMYAFLRALFLYPANLLTLRALGFFSLSFTLGIFLVYAFGGLWKRKRYGYWLGVIFLAALNAKNVYFLGLTIYGLMVGSPTLSSAFSENESQAIVIFDLIVQSVVFVLVLVLFLKVLFGKSERTFFQPAPPVHSDFVRLS